MANRKNILILIPSLRAGGAERTLINLLHKIDPERFELDLVVVSKFGPYIEDVPDHVNESYLFSNTTTARIIAYLHRRFNFAWIFKKKMQRFNKKYEVGISYLDSKFTELLFYTDKIEKRISFVHSSYKTHDNYELFYKHKRYNQKLRKERYSKLDAIYFVSNDSMNEFKDIFGEYPKMNVIHNMIDRDAILRKSKREPIASSNKQFTFTAVGSLMMVKGFDRLIRSAALIRDDGYQFKVEIIGAGDQQSNLRKLIRTLNVEDIVTLHGFIPNPYPLMKQSDVFVMSSISEALPTVLCEAMILGLPTLVTNCSGCRGLVNSGEFGLMAEQDDKDLAEKMKKYMDDPDLIEYYRKKSIVRSKLFDDKRILNEYYDIFEGII